MWWRAVTVPYIPKLDILKRTFCLPSHICYLPKDKEIQMLTGLNFGCVCVCVCVCVISMDYFSMKFRMCLLVHESNNF